MPNLQSLNFQCRDASRDARFEAISDRRTGVDDRSLQSVYIDVESRWVVSSALVATLLQVEVEAQDGRVSDLQALSSVSYVGAIWFLFSCSPISAD